MKNKEKAEIIYNELYKMFPQAHCELNYRNGYELLIAVVLSAQTTDKSVNQVTVELFNKYPDSFSLALANQKDVERIISRLGLYRNKSKNIIFLADQLSKEFNGVVPDNMESLLTLAGVGRKTANVVLSELYEIPAIAVDTHVSRVSKRLKIATLEDDVTQIEAKLMRMFPKEQWHKLHHLMIFFGRYHCTAKKPLCEQCSLNELCRKNKIV